MMRLIIHDQPVALVQLPPDAPHPTWAVGNPLVSITRTRTETSVICPTTALPDDVPGPVKVPLVAIAVDEVLGFSKIGLLVAMYKPLADAGIPVLNLSTYQTDWVFLDAENVQPAAAVWRAAGYEVVTADPLNDKAPPRRTRKREPALKES